MFSTAREWLSGLRQLQSSLKPANWPSQCHICRAWPRQSFCEDCIARFAQPRQRCPTCALPWLDPGCHCSKEPPALDACLCAVDYDYPWADCVTRLKFHDAPQSARHLAQLMRHAPWVEHALDQTQWVVPIPLAMQRLRERGYNQALELAKHLAPDKVQSTWLLRHDSPTHQVGASRQERFDNVRDMFWLDPKSRQHLQNKRIVLVDDVMTSGASLFEAARVLRLAGARHITGLVFARTPSGLGARQ